MRTSLDGIVPLVNEDTSDFQMALMNLNPKFL